MFTLPAEMPDTTVCIVGMGFVGVTLAAALAHRGFNIIGVEIRKDLVEKLNAGTAHFFEPGLSEQLTAAVDAKRLRVYDALPADCPATVYIITVGTPLGADGRTDLSSILTISHQIAACLKDDDLVLLRSTVKIGTTRSVVKPILQSSGKRFALAFCPERTVEGQALAELPVLPQVIGAEDFGVGMRAARLFQILTPTVLRVSDPETAEMIKLVDNATRDLIFAYSNEVAGLCDAIGLSADEVIRSGRFGYSRTGLPKPGPVGGPCLSKDPHILCESLEAYGIDPKLTRMGRQINEELPSATGRAVAKMVKARAPGLSTPRIAILGMAFKGRPATDDIRGTTVDALIAGIREELPEADLCGYDPLVAPDVTATFGVEPTASLEAAFTNAHAAVLHTDHVGFASMPVAELARLMRKPALIYDFWNLFTAVGLVLPDGVDYVALGSHSRPLRGRVAAGGASHHDHQ